MTRVFHRAPLASLLVLALAGCSSVKVPSANLDALHGERGRHRYTAELTSPWRRTMAAISGSISIGEDAWVAGSVPKRVKNPTKRILKELLALASFESQAPSVQASQVRAYAWLAMVDPAILVRERAFLELAEHARRLQLEPPPEPIDPATVVDPAEFLELVRGLYDVVPPLLARGSRATATERADFEAALDLLRERSYDVEGGRRLLKALAILLDGERASREELRPLLELSLTVQRTLTEQALARGLRDPAPRARAAAFRAAHAAYGDAFLAEAILCLDNLSGTNLEHFGLRTQRPEDEDVFLAVYELVIENGLPSGDPWGEGLNEGRRGLRQLNYLLSVLRVALNYTRFHDRPRTLAILTLLEVQPGGPRTLRAEEWQDWWAGWAEIEGERLRALSEAPAEGAEGSPSEEP